MSEMRFSERGGAWCAAPLSYEAPCPAFVTPASVSIARVFLPVVARVI